MATPPETSAAASPKQAQEYRFNASTGVLLGAAALVGWVLIPIWQPLLFAGVLAATMVGMQEWLTRRLWQRRYVAAGLLTVGIIVLILTPLGILTTIAIREAIDAFNMLREVYREFRAEGMEAAVHRLPDNIERVIQPILDRLPQNLNALPTSAGDAGRWLATQLQGVVTTAAEFALDLTMMLIALFFLLADGHRVMNWVVEISPIGRDRTRELMHEFRLVSRSIVGSNFVTGAAQAIVATIGYYIASVPQPMFFGLLTLLMSFLPAVGTAMVAFPLVGLLLLTGHPWAALFLGIWSLAIVGLVDNVLRPYMLRADLHVHGVVVFFFIIGGIGMFGFAGLAVGPIALAFFLSMLRFHARDLRRPKNLSEQATPPPIPES